MHIVHNISDRKQTDWPSLVINVWKCIYEYSVTRKLVFLKSLNTSIDDVPKFCCNFHFNFTIHWQKQRKITPRKPLCTHSLTLTISWYCGLTGVSGDVVIDVDTIITREVCSHSTSTSVVRSAQVVCKVEALFTAARGIYKQVHVIYR